jgi:chemotaxis protein MotB
MTTNTYIIGIAVLLAFACIGLGWWCHELNKQLGNCKGELALVEGECVGLQETVNELREGLKEKEGKAVNLAGELEAARTRVRKLETEKSEAAKAQELLEKEMQDALAEQEVTISRLKGKLTVNILDRIMFDSGKAELKEKGREILLKMAEVLQTVPDRQILVVGHTDNVPVTASRHLFATNWELSASRATAAVRFLTEEGGVPAQNLGALGYGEYHPIAENTTKEGRAQNRRIEVVILENDILQLVE